MVASKRVLVLKYECDSTLPCRYNSEDGRIKQILINIINNAVKFPRWAMCVSLLLKRREKVFEAFRQANAKRNRSVDGTGLGLAIVKHLVQHSCPAF